MTQQTIGTDVLEHTFDRSGNMVIHEYTRGGSPVEIGYTYDAWNRLVKVDHGGALRSEYRYNGLNWRVLKRTYLFTGDQQRLMYYSANWQLLEERIDDDFDAQTPDVDRHMQYIQRPCYLDGTIARLLISSVAQWNAPPKVE